MSDTDGFIEEVTEEVRRDKMFDLYRRYGWIAVVAVLLLVGVAASNEWQRAQARTDSEALGDALVAALELDSASDRSAALQKISVVTADGEAIVRLLTAAELVSEDRRQDALAVLNSIDENPDVQTIYRQIAEFKALVISAKIHDSEDRRQGFKSLIDSGSALRLLCEEQLALIEIDAGERDAALMRLQTLLQDSEVTPGMRRRVSQIITALGATPGAAQTDG